jgi:hypothetical protein
MRAIDPRGVSMFLLRSAFWLTVAFLVIHPGVDLKGTASGLASAAMAAGHDLIAQQIADAECIDLQCTGAKAAISVAFSSIPSADGTMQSPADGPVPFPRPRPDWMG